MLTLWRGERGTASLGSGPAGSVSFDQGGLLRTGIAWQCCCVKLTASYPLKARKF